MAAKNERPINGWTAIGSDPASITRHDHPPIRFYEERLQGDPISPAWNEPGYLDPDKTHENLPPGSRYWQGYAKDYAAKEKL